MNLYNKKYFNFWLVPKVHTFGTKGGYCVPSVPARSRHLPATPDLNIKRWILCSNYAYKIIYKLQAMKKVKIQVH